jgi:hypothetical protein
VRVIITTSSRLPYSFRGGLRRTSTDVRRLNSVLEREFCVQLAIPIDAPLHQRLPSMYEFTFVAVMTESSVRILLGLSFTPCYTSLISVCSEGHLLLAPDLELAI